MGWTRSGRLTSWTDVEFYAVAPFMHGDYRDFVFNAGTGGKSTLAKTPMGGYVPLDLRSGLKRGRAGELIFQGVSRYGLKKYSIEIFRIANSSWEKLSPGDPCSSLREDENFALVSPRYTCKADYALCRGSAASVTELGCNKKVDCNFLDEGSSILASDRVEISSTKTLRSRVTELAWIKLSIFL